MSNSHKPKLIVISDSILSAEQKERGYLRKDEFPGAWSQLQNRPVQDDIFYIATESAACTIALGSRIKAETGLELTDMAALFIPLSFLIVDKTKRRVLEQHYDLTDVRSYGDISTALRGEGVMGACKRPADRALPCAITSTGPGY